MKFDQLEKYILGLLDKELDPRLTYHGLHHTIDVMNVVRDYIDRCGLGDEDGNLLLTGALLHDCGFLNTYQLHEQKGAEIASQILPEYNYSQAQISIVENLILATKVPQQPRTKLEKIICDADLDYLGRADFHSIAESLFKELQNFDVIHNRDEWNRIQLNFLKNHNYHTEFALKYRKPQKEKHLVEIMEQIQ